MHMSLAGQMQNMRMEITEEIKQNVRTSVTDAVQKSFETVANTRMFPLFSKAWVLKYIIQNLPVFEDL